MTDDIDIEGPSGFSDMVKRYGLTAKAFVDYVRYQAALAQQQASPKPRLRLVWSRDEP